MFSIKNPFAEKTTLDMASKQLLLSERALLDAQARLEYAKADVMAHTGQVMRLREIVANKGFKLEGASAQS